MTAGEWDLKPAVRRVRPVQVSRWWHNHLGIVLVIPLLLGGTFLSPYVPSVASALVWLSMPLFLICSIGSLFGYHKEASHFKEQNGDWVPDKWAYTLAHFFLSPFVAAPIYLFRRWRRVGLEWESLPLYRFVFSE